MMVRPVNGTARGDFLKMPIALSRPYPSNEYKYSSIAMDYNWRLQMDKKIIAPDPATCNITLSPV
jgi:hypothetical protein